MTVVTIREKSDEIQLPVFPGFKLAEPVPPVRLEQHGACAPVGAL